MSDLLGEFEAPRGVRKRNGSRRDILRSLCSWSIDFDFALVVS